MKKKVKKSQSKLFLVKIRIFLTILRVTCSKMPFFWYFFASCNGSKIGDIAQVHFLGMEHSFFHIFWTDICLFLEFFQKNIDSKKLSILLRGLYTSFYISYIFEKITKSDLLIGPKKRIFYVPLAKLCKKKLRFLQKKAKIGYFWCFLM